MASGWLGVEEGVMLPVQSAVAEYRESQVTLCDRSTISGASNRVPSKGGTHTIYKLKESS